MKKVIFALAAVVALAACSNEQTIVADKGAAIGFDTFVENSTRANDPSYTNSNLFANFGVFGTVNGAELFDDVAVTGSGINGTWTYEGTQYWITGAKYNFAAVAPKTLNGAAVYTNAEYNVTNTDGVYSGTTTLSFVNNGTTDLLYAEATAVGLDGSGDAEDPANAKVGFNFRHVLSKVKFTFTNLYNASNATIRVENIRIMDTYNSGVATLNNNTAWAPESNSNNLVLNFGNAAVDAVDAEEAFACNAKKESYNELLMIPGAGATDYEGDNVYTVKFNVVLLVSEQEIATYEHTIYTTFAPEAGHSYNIAASITPANIDPATSQEAIVFTVSDITDWTNGNTVDTDVPADGVNDAYPIN